MTDFIISYQYFLQVLLGACYRGLAAVLKSVKVTGTTCYTIKRGYGLPPVDTCSGMDKAPNLLYCECYLNTINV